MHQKQPPAKVAFSNLLLLQQDIIIEKIKNRGINILKNIFNESRDIILFYLRYAEKFYFHGSTTIVIIDKGKF
jgi:hypothetical protein